MTISSQSLREVRIWGLAKHLVDKVGGCQSYIPFFAEHLTLLIAEVDAANTLALDTAKAVERAAMANQIADYLDSLRFMDGDKGDACQYVCHQQAMSIRESIAPADQSALSQIVAHRTGELIAMNARWKKAIEGLTPSGSEYVDDPEACAAAIRARTTVPQMVIKLREQLAEADQRTAELRREVDTLKGHLRWLTNLSVVSDRYWDGIWKCRHCDGGTICSPTCPFQLAKAAAVALAAKGII